MGKIISFANQKGGVGKTTTAVNLAAAIGLLGKRVLLVDMDPQGNATSGLGIKKDPELLTSYHLLIETAQAKEVIIQTEFENVDVIPSSTSLAGAEVELVGIKDRAKQLKTQLQLMKSLYDYIFIDCPPSLGLITINAFTASDTVLIPIQCEFYALEGLMQLIATIRQVKASYNPEIELEGVLLTMYDGRLNLTLQVAAEVKKYLPKKAYKNVIPRNVRLSEAPSYGQPIMYYDKASKGSKAYVSLGKEFLKKSKKVNKKSAL